MNYIGSTRLDVQCVAPYVMFIAWLLRRIGSWLPFGGVSHSDFVERIIKYEASHLTRYCVLACSFQTSKIIIFLVIKSYNSHMGKFPNQDNYFSGLFIQYKPNPISQFGQVRSCDLITFITRVPDKTTLPIICSPPH